MAKSETAGVIAKANWNVASGASSSSSPLKLVDDTGALTNSTVSWTSDGVWNTGVADVAGNNRMMRGYLDTGNGNPSTASFAGLAAGVYNVYVYVDGDNATYSRTATYGISGTGVTSSSVTLIDAPNADFGGTFIRASGSTGNYVLFNNVTISSGFTLTATPGAADWAPRAPINGIQVIPVSLATPDFTVTASPASQTVTAGNSVAYTIAVGGVNTFSGTVSLSASGLPSGATATFSPAAITGSGSSILTVTTIGSTRGTSSLSIAGKSGSLSHSAALTLVVGAPVTPVAMSINFVGSGNPMAASEAAGVVSKTNWNSAAGASSNSALPLVSETGSATGASATWSSDNTWGTSVPDIAGNNRMMAGYLDNGTGNSSKVNISGMVAGKYDIYVYLDGDNGGAARTGIYQLSGTGITTASISATDAANANFGGAFVLASNSSSGNYVLFSGVTISSGFTLTATPGAGDWAPRAPLNGMQIIPSVTDFSLALSQGAQALVQGTKATLNATVGAMNGFNGQVTFAASGLPSGASVSFSPATVAASGTAVATISTSTTTPAGTSTLTITATSGSLSHSATVALTVQAIPPPVVTISVSPASSLVMAGQTQQLASSVTGSTNTAVTWSVNPSIGTVSSSGMYSAPASMGIAQQVIVTAVSAADSSKSASANLTVAAQLAISTASLAGGTANTSYNATLTATGGIAPYNWSIASGALPSGLTLTASSGSISGTPAAGTYSFTAAVGDSAGHQATRSYSVTIAAPANAYYVSALNGNDGWSGRLSSPNQPNTDGPFKTLARAQSAMQSSTIKTTIVRAGTYSIASTLNLGGADNGEAWIGYAGETAILEGNKTGNLNLNRVNNVTIEGLTIQNMSATGIHVDTVSGLTLRWNTILNSNQNAVFGYVLQNSVIDSNIINGQSPGNISGNGSTPYWAIELGIASSNNKITHNLIQNCQGGGINFGAGPSDPANNNNLIDRNILKNVNTRSSDTGAIYFYDMSHSATGLQITNNIIDGNGDGSMSDASNAIYLDNGTSNALISGNLCRNCGQYAWHMNWGDHNTFVNNIFDLSSSGTQLGIYQDWNQSDRVPGNYGMVSNVFSRNIIYFSGAAPSSLYTVGILSSDATPADSGNLYYSATGQGIPNTLPIVDSSPFYSNPQFANPAGGNYSMPSSSPAYTSIHFQPLATDQGPVSYAP